MGIACTSEIEKERKIIEIEREKILKEREKGKKKLQIWKQLLKRQLKEDLILLKN